jgi:epoxyqueuosine reductase QueG
MKKSERKKLTGDMKRFARAHGADMVGIASAESFSGAPKGHHPRDLLKGAESVVVMALALPAAALERAPSREYSMSYLIANQELNTMAFKVAKYLEHKGFRAVPVPASPPYDLVEMMGDLSHRHAGYLAGLGVFGKNSLLLSPDHGPGIRLVSVVTDAALEADEILKIDLCGDCTVCIKACPANALKGQGVVDKSACDDRHVVVGKQLQLSYSELICGVCIRVCPVGRTGQGKKQRKK